MVNGSYIRPKESLTERLTCGSIIDIEIDLENQATEEGIARYNKASESAIKRGDGAKMKPEEALLVSWWPDYVSQIKEEQAACRHGKAGKGRGYYGSLINLVSAEKIALLSMHEIISRCLVEPFGATLRSVSYNVGNAVIAELHATAMKQRKITPKEIDKMMAEGVGGSRLTREINRAAKNTMDDHVWSMRICTYLGVALIWRLVGIANVSKVNDGFVLGIIVRKKYKDGKPTNVVQLSDEAKEILERGHFLREVMRPRFMPMLAMPMPWSYSEEGEIQEGGHYRLRTPFVVKPSTALRNKMKVADLSVPFEVLNVVSRTPWVVNGVMKDVISDVVKRGGGCAGLPRSQPLPIPPKPFSLTSTPESMKEWAKAARQVHESNEEEASARGGLILALNVASRMEALSAPIFFPHQFDFRGRVYPVPIHLNHIGDDSRRGMLLFAEAKQPENDHYLQIHTANCWGHGVDKFDFKARRNWVESLGGELRAYAEDPVTNAGWMKAEDPFQFLQCCMGLINPAIGWRIPIHFDGSANGIQHLAAITRDEIGGKSVNLVPCDCPGDVYSDVAASTVDILNKMVEAGNPIAERCIGLIRRKLVKQPVMTSVYGVTRSGIQNQLLPRLIEQGVPKIEAMKLSCWLAPVIIMGIGGQCRGAAGVMTWMREAVDIILRADRKRSISWTSPMGFPVIQPYWKQSSIQVDCHRSLVSLRLPDENDKQHIGRNKNAIVANIIHSFDASHMGFTAIECEKAGVSFAAVHDSYWTHQATAKKLDGILRRTFIDMHSKDPLSRIREDWIQRYNVELPELPNRGTLDLEQIKNSEYFFS